MKKLRNLFLSYKVYLDSEVGRIKGVLKEYAKTGDVLNDGEMYSLVESFLGKIDEFKVGYEEEELTTFILAAQQVVKEIQNNGK